MNATPEITIIKAYCNTHTCFTWHILVNGSTFECLECRLRDRKPTLLLIVKRTIEARENNDTPQL